MTALKPGHRIVFVDGRNGPERMRAGKVWSAAPEASTYWVVTDDDRAYTAVKVPTRRQAEAGAMPHAVAMVSQADRELTARRLKALSTVPALFGTVDSAQPALDGTQPVTFHVDRACPVATAPGVARAQRYGRPYTIPAYRATDILTGRRSIDLTLCRRCVYLETDQ